MIEERADGRIYLSGPLLIADAPAVFKAGLEFLRPAESARIYDFSSAGPTDSSALAVLFGWLRAARERGVTLRVAALPAGMLDLAALYGVTGLLPDA